MDEFRAVIRMKHCIWMIGIAVVGMGIPAANASVSTYISDSKVQTANASPASCLAYSTPCSNVLGIGIYTKKTTGGGKFVNSLMDFPSPSTLSLWLEHESEGGVSPAYPEGSAGSQQMGSLTISGPSGAGWIAIQADYHSLPLDPVTIDPGAATPEPRLYGVLLASLLLLTPACRKWRVRRANT
jgi:hypothetical protein